MGLDVFIIRMFTSYIYRTLFNPIPMFGAPFPRMHVSLYVQDVQASESFYTKFFGLPPVKQKADYLKYVLPSPALIISFVQRADHVHAGFGHLGVQVATAQELQQHLERVRAAGLTVVEEMGTTCCYAVQDKFWVQDPDGHHWEIYVFTEDAEFEAPSLHGMDLQSVLERNTEGDAEPAACCTPVAIGGTQPAAVRCC